MGTLTITACALLQVGMVIIVVRVVWDLIVSLSCIVAVAVAVAVWAETPVAMAVSRLVEHQGHAFKGRNNLNYKTNAEMQHSESVKVH